MKVFNVLFTDAAFDDLRDLFTWIASQADESTARRFVDRIEARISKLAYFPERGTPHPEIRADIRSLSFERTHLIFFHVDKNHVWVDRIISARRDFDNLN